jgi:hypothetical protein
MEIDVLTLLEELTMNNYDDGVISELEYDAIMKFLTSQKEVTQ